MQLPEVNIVANELIPLWDPVLWQHRGFVNLRMFAENQKLTFMDVTSIFIMSVTVWVTTKSLYDLN